MSDITRILRRFCLALAPSGYEGIMASLLKEELSPYCDDISCDRAGNVIGFIGGTDDAPFNVMVFAHMDSVGFVVRSIEPSGLIRIDRLGGIPEKILPGLRLSLFTEDGDIVEGIIGNKSHHGMTAEEKLKVDPIGSLIVDIGASSAQEVRDNGIEVGCFASYTPSFQQLLGTRVSGTAIDDRGGCAALVEIARLAHENPPPCNLYIVGTVWEEFNLRGAMVAARSIQPDVGIALDVCLTGDTPEVAGRFETGLSGGPVLTAYSFHGRGTLNGTLSHRGLMNNVKIAAREADIPLQRFASTGILTDAAYLQLEDTGVACVELAFPARYTHSPVEVCDTKDLDLLAQLVAATLERLDSSFDPSRYRI